MCNNLHVIHITGFHSRLILTLGAFVGLSVFRRLSSPVHFTNSIWRSKKSRTLGCGQDTRQQTDNSLTDKDYGGDKICLSTTQHAEYKLQLHCLLLSCSRL